jgi:hypothetical protein
VEFVEVYPARSLDPWIDEKTFESISAAAKESETAFLKPIFDRLNGTVSYEHIRVALARLKANVRAAAKS